MLFHIETLSQGSCQTKKRGSDLRKKSMGDKIGVILMVLPGMILREASKEKAPQLQSFSCFLTLYNVKKSDPIGIRTQIVRTGI
jgi:hypothetical protein